MPGFFIFPRSQDICLDYRVQFYYKNLIAGNPLINGYKVYIPSFHLLEGKASCWILIYRNAPHLLDFFYFS